MTNSLSMLDNNELTSLEKEIGEAKFDLILKGEKVTYNMYTAIRLVELARGGRDVTKFANDLNLNPTYLAKILKGEHLNTLDYSEIHDIVVQSEGRVTEEMFVNLGILDDKRKSINSVIQGNCDPHDLNWTEGIKTEDNPKGDRKVAKIINFASMITPEDNEKLKKLILDDPKHEGPMQIIKWFTFKTKGTRGEDWLEVNSETLPTPNNLVKVYKKTHQYPEIQVFKLKECVYCIRQYVGLGKTMCSDLIVNSNTLPTINEILSTEGTDRYPYKGTMEEAMDLYDCELDFIGN